MFYVYYLFVEGDNQPFYVGKTNRIKNRLNEHKSHANTETNLKARKIAKAIREGKRVILKVIATVSTEDEVNVIEKQMIALHGRRDIGTGFLCNHTDGGEGCIGHRHSEESRTKMSEAKKGNKINVGRNRPDMIERFSKPVTAFYANGQVIGTYSSSRVAENELGVSYKAISDVLTGKIKSTKKDGNTFTFQYGQIESNIDPVVHRRRNNSNTVFQYTKDNEFVASFRTIKEATNITGFTGIAGALSGDFKTSGGYIWRRVSNKD